MKNLFFAFLLTMSTGVMAANCSEAGPQTPRDITKTKGSNPSEFEMAPDYDDLNLCNIHFHKNAEHKGPGFSVSAGSGEFGGYQCNQTKDLTEKELVAPKVASCKNLVPGDTVEVHWVYTSCNIKPGEGLGACSSAACANPQLRVETQVFLLTNNSDADDFNDFNLNAKKVEGKHQAKKLPKGGKPVEFLGSTTGPSYNNDSCSPLQVSWSVRPKCNTLDINTLHKWCEKNDFNENKAHGVRELVTNPKFLSEID